MKHLRLTLLTIATSAMLMACGTNPVGTSLLDQSRSDYLLAQSNPKVASFAALEMKQAGEALAKANVAASSYESPEAIDKLAYLAKQKIAITQEVASQRAAEKDIADSGRAIDQVRLEQRTLEADQARTSAQMARAVTQRAQSETAAAEQQTRDAQLKTQEAQQRTTLLESQLATLAAQKTQRGFVITLGDVLFGTDLARLNPEGMNTAQKLADILRDNPQRSVLVEGFTDSTVSTTHNQELSERRARAVTRALMDMGISAERISSMRLGEFYPVAANDNAKNRQLNRRVEIILSDETGRITPR